MFMMNSKYNFCLIMYPSTHTASIQTNIFN